MVRTPRTILIPKSDGVMAKKRSPTKPKKYQVEAAHHDLCAPFVNNLHKPTSISTPNGSGGSDIYIC